MEKKELFKALYNACRAKVAESYRNDPSAVKALRDHECYTRYGRAYSELTTSELIAMIDSINSSDGSAPPTQKQLNTFRFYSFAVALAYIDFGTYEYCDRQTGEMLAGEPMRKLLVDSFCSNARTMPPNVVRRIYEEYINPKSNEFLQQGGFKKSVRNPAVIYYERLNQMEIRYLIARFSLIYNEKINKTTVKQNIMMN